jgi:glycosyltransferase involved in cell wall biosynthesis
MKKQKITYIADLRLPTDKAHSVQIMKMCEAFALEGVEVELVIPDKRNNLGESKIFEYYDIKTPFKITKISTPDLLGRSQRFGRLFYWVDFLVFLVGLRLMRRPEAGGIIYSRNPKLLTLFSKRDYRLVVEIHSLPKRRFLFFKFLRRATGVVTITKHLQSLLVEEGFRKEMTLVAPDAVDIETFNLSLGKEEARERLDLPKDKILIGYVGMLKTMGMEKGIGLALSSLKSLEDNKTLVLVGGHKSEIEFYQKMATDLGVSSKVIFVGRVYPKQVPIYLKAFDVLIAPFPDNEHYRYFMSPLKLFEYMASGVPIVISDLPSLREIVDESGVNFFQAGNHEDLTRAIKEVFKNPDEAKNKITKSLSVVQRHTWVNRAGSILSFLASYTK